MNPYKFFTDALKRTNPILKRILICEGLVLTLLIVLAAISSKTSSNSSLIVKTRQSAEIRYKLEDASAVAQYRGKKIKEKVIRTVSNLFTRKGEKSKLEPVSYPSLSPVVVSESGLPEEELERQEGETPRVKGAAVLGESDSEELYIQYLPLPSLSNFSTSAFTGASTVSYPIKTPPGPGGFAPTVSLNYSSAAVDELMKFVRTDKKYWHVRQSGPVGLGWRVIGGDWQISIDTHG